MRRDLGLYGLLIAGVVLIVVTVRPRDADLPRTTGFAWPTVAIEGLSVPGTKNYPEFVARHAEPGSTRSVKIGGQHDRLILRGVAVRLTAGQVMTADTGELTAGRLELTGRVRVEGVLEAARIEFRDGDVRFFGVSVFETVRGRESAVDLTISRRELLRRLQR